jgi:GrpB-like predicted nucleotidyltransferase (UPF0157 family)/ribosomal protein S18 acetylase RimI-like enzyme
MPLIRATLGPALLGIEHIGSTAVPGLIAKPTIDILAGVAGRPVAESALPALAALGYTGTVPGDTPDWYYCLGKREHGRHTHLHLTRHGSRFWQRHIEFRDFLRASPAVAAEYARLKQALAARWPEERMRYCLAKSSFIRRVEAQAGGVRIEPLDRPGVTALAETFRPWHKPVEQFGLYLTEQERGERQVMVAGVGSQTVGYATLVRESAYPPFRTAGIPEVVDLNVITGHQCRSIGSALVWKCEVAAASGGAKAIGISVVQSDDCAAANALYPRLGFEPDGRGITAADNELHLTKELIAFD